MIDMINLFLALLSVTTLQLNKDWQLYENKPVIVTGKIVGIGITYVLYLTDNVVARITLEELRTADKFKIGQKVKLKCTGAGYAFGGPLLLECSL